MDLEKIKKDILENSVDFIYQTYLTGNEVWYFKEYLEDQDYSATYDAFKRYINDKLGIRVHEIAVFGSAKVGVSFSPDKNLRAFQEDSDIDVTLVSRDYYYKFWNAYLEILYNQEIVSYNVFAKGVFRKFIELSEFPQDNDTFKEWNTKADSKFIQDLQFQFGIAQEINYRIFESWDAVENYYKSGIRQLKNKLIIGG